MTPTLPWITSALSTSDVDAVGARIRTESPEIDAVLARDTEQVAAERASSSEGGDG
jgi:hypothetical protein